MNSEWEHLTFAAKLEIGVRSQESGARRKEEEGRRKKKCFYKYEMLPSELCRVNLKHLTAITPRISLSNQFLYPGL
jgi:hypothetical protein